MRRPTKAHNGQTQAPQLQAPSGQQLQPRLQQSPGQQLQQMPGIPGFPARNNMMTPPPSNNYGPRSAPSAIAGGAGSAPTLEQRMQALQQRTSSSFTMSDVEPCFFRRILNMSRTTAVCYTNLNKFCACALIFERFRWRRRYGTDATTQCRVWQGSRFSWWPAHPVVTCHVYMTV